MISTRLVWIGASWMLALAPACQGKGTEPAPTTKQAEGKPAEAQQVGAASVASQAAGETRPAAPAADGGPTPGGNAAAGGEQGSVPAPEPSKALGAHLADPPWYRKTMFGDGAKVLDTKRSQADDQGRFSSLIRFELSDMTAEACADHLQQKVAGEVPNVEREVQPDGRIQLKGSTESYSLTFICGQAQGKTIAYVSYQWT